MVSRISITKDVRRRRAAASSAVTPTYGSTVTQNLWDAGAVMLGKLNMDEFAMGSSNETSRFGPPTNPWRRKGDNQGLTPGGSSGGSGCSACQAIFAWPRRLPTRAGRSASRRRSPARSASANLWPREPLRMVAFASSLDQAGPIAKTVEDSAILLEVMCSHDPEDSTSLPIETPDWRADVTKGVKGMRIGIPKEYRVDGMSDEIDALWQQGIEWLKASGASCRDQPAAYEICASSILHRGAG
ncbi:MAG: amidase [Hyphomonas sp.]